MNPFCPDCAEKGNSVPLVRKPYDQGTLLVFACPKCGGEWTSGINLERLYHSIPVEDPRIQDLKDIAEREKGRTIKKILSDHIAAAGLEIACLLIDRARREANNADLLGPKDSGISPDWPGTGWCAACQTWRNTLDGGDVIEAYENQVKHMRDRVSFLEHYIAGLRQGPPKPKGRRNPAMKKGQVPRRLSTGVVCGQAQGNRE